MLEYKSRGLCVSSPDRNQYIFICFERQNYMADEREVRLQRLHALRERGINPYPNRVERTHTIAEVLQHFDEWRGEEGDFILTGRIRLRRPQGGVTFAQIE